MVPPARGARGDLVYESKRMRDVVRHAERYARGPSVIALVGERGSGRTELARRIHKASGLPGKFVVVFASGGPKSRRAALLERSNDSSPHVRARGGTLLIHSLCKLDCQLLHDIGLATAFSTRLIFAISPDLAAEDEVRNVLLEQLFQRQPLIPVYMPPAPVVIVRLPPLRERTDIRAVVRAILGRISHGHGRPKLSLLPDALAALQAYSWPGNIAELEEVLEDAALRCADRNVIAAADLPESIRPASDRTESDLTETGIGPPASSVRAEDDLTRTLAQVEASYVLRMLDACAGNRQLAAKRLGIHRNTLSRKLQQLSDLRTEKGGYP